MSHCPSDSGYHTWSFCAFSCLLCLTLLFLFLWRSFVMQLCASPCPDVVDFVENSGELFPGIDGPSVVIAPTEPPSDGTPVTAPTIDQTLAPTPQVDPAAFALRRSIWTTMYGTDVPPGVPLLWTSADVQEAVARYSCATATAEDSSVAMPCTIQVTEIIDASSNLIPRATSIVTSDDDRFGIDSLGFNLTNTSGFDEAIAQLDVSNAPVPIEALTAFVFRGSLEGPNGAAEALILAWTSKDNAWKILPLFDWTLYAIPEEFAANSTVRRALTGNSLNTAGGGLVSGVMSVKSILSSAAGRSLVARRRLTILPTWCWMEAESEAGQLKCGGGSFTVGDVSCRATAIESYFEILQLIFQYCWSLITWCLMNYPSLTCWIWIWAVFCWLMNWNCETLLSDMMVSVYHWRVYSCLNRPCLRCLRSTLWCSLAAPSLPLS